ncbi:MAG: TrkA C-terminal domain-containing protein [Lachnospiraceae bacterium]|nr:TrkA C-terminal domain-containing protein [Lachnospiraceae bacterium]
MNIYLAFTLFALIILIYWIISEVFAMLFRFTGLPDEKARFQVISLLTGCGFTTRESEMIISTRSRRRLARVTMLFGYVFNITIVTAFINVFMSLKIADLAADVLGFLIPVLAIVVIIVFMRVPAVRAWGDRFFEKLAGRIVRQDGSNTIMLLDYIGQDSIVQVSMQEVPESLKGKTLSQSGLRTEHNILVMFVEGTGGKAIPVTGDMEFWAGDKLTVFGNYKEIGRVFEARERFSD